MSRLDNKSSNRTPSSPFQKLCEFGLDMSLDILWTIGLCILRLCEAAFFETSITGRRELG